MAAANDVRARSTDAPRLFVVTYRPLACNAYGTEASERHGIPPFVDGSVRREPDLEHDWPSISCLCRKGKFAPRLQVGDHVVYLTHKGRYGDDADARHWRMTAVLRVARRFDTHRAAARWYESEGMALPNNCIVPGNKAFPLHLSHMHGRQKGAVRSAGCKAKGSGTCGKPRDAGCHTSATGCGGGIHAEWDRIYRKRARQHPQFVVCEPLYRELGWNAPMVHEEDLEYALGTLPGTRNPGGRPIKGLRRLMRRLGIPVPPSCP